VGEITAMLPAPTQYSSGLRALSAEVALENGQLINYPLANLELLG